MLLSAAIPELLEKLIRASEERSRKDISDQLREASIQRLTYEQESDAGYIYLAASRPLNIAERAAIEVTHGECVSLDTLPGVVVIDIDNLGRLMGIELLGYAEIFEKMSQATR